MTHSQPPSRADNFSRLNDERHILRVIAVGSLTAVNYHVMQMVQLGYAEPHE